MRTSILSPLAVAALIVSASAFSPLRASAQSRAASPKSCPMLFAPAPRLRERIVTQLNTQLPAKYRLAPALKPLELATIEDARDAFAKSGMTERAGWERVAQWIGRSIDNPYNMMFDLHAAAEKTGTTARHELRALFAILAEPKSGVRTEQLNEWTKSETHAVLLYSILNQRGLALFADEITELARLNLFFSDAHVAKGKTLLTYSFEKEGRGTEITMFYRPFAVDEVAWFKLTDDVRFKTIDDMKLRQKNFLPASVLAPTSLKPAYLSGYSVDGTTPNAVKSWEITHKGFEISLHRVMSEVKDVSQFLKETHSLHVHTVFELPRRYTQFSAFRSWFKELNDSLYLHGMEEGLHGNYLTSVANLPEDVAKTKDRFGIIRAGRAADVGRENNKFFSAGLRGGIYGPASSPQNVKLGIELRDTTRNMARLEQTMTRLSDSIANRRWETTHLGRLNDVEQPTRLRTDQAETIEKLKLAGLRTSIAEEMFKAEKTVGIPMLNLENGPVFNYETGRYEYASTEYAARAKAARFKFVRGLFALQLELDGFAAKGEEVESEDIGTAVRQLLTEWARQAKPGERFNF